MTHTKVPIAFMTCLVVSSSVAIAQSRIDPASAVSLEQLTALAFERSPEIMAARARIEAARGELQQAALRPNPTITAARREEPAGSDNQTSVMLQLPLDLFRRDGRVETATAALAAIEIEIANEERLLASAVRERAGAVLVAARRLAVTGDLIAITRQTYDLLAARVAEGATRPLDRDIAEAELRRLEAEQAARSTAAETAAVALKATIGLAPDAALALRDDIEQQLRADADWPVTGERATAEVAIQQRADVREAAARVDLADARMRQRQREGRFDLGIYGTYMRMDAGFPQRGFGAAGSLERVRGVFHYVEAGGTLTLPVFNRNQGLIAAAAAEKQAAERTREARELLVRAELAVARIRDEETRRSLGLYVTARDLARRNVEVVRESYQLGRSTLFELFAEQRRLLDSETAYVEALARAFEARTELIRSSGASR